MEEFGFSHTNRRRVGLVSVSLAMVILFAGLFKLQVIDHESLALQSDNNSIRVVPILPRRGHLYDREGRVIVDNRPSYTVSIVPAEENPELTVPVVSELLELDTAFVRKRMKRNMVSWYQPSPIKRDIDFETVAILEEQSYGFPGVAYQMERVRQYPEKEGMESFTGYVGEVSEDELKRLGGRSYRLGSMIGKKGLEKQYDELLRGYEGTEFVEVSASGQHTGKYEDRPSVPAVPGADIYLTIDEDIQLACSRALDTFCCGAILALDPNNGEVLAMVSYPGYDANIFSSVIPESLWNEIRTDSTHPLLNRPMNGMYPPGSTTKFVTLGAGLEEGLIRYNTTFKSCAGGFQFGNRFFRCWKAAGHGVVNGVHAIEQSCDVYFYQLGIKLGVDELSRYYDLCGFGKLTGVDLPGESPGLNPNSEYYDKRYGKRKWSRGLVLNNSIGQGELLVNIIQLAQFFAGMANNGEVYRPHLVKRVVRSDQTSLEIERELSFRLPFSQRTLDILNEGLKMVVDGEQGTARAIQSDMYSIGGKTGTVQNPHGENHSWFVGIAPLDNPEIVVAAIVENAGDGSEVAAPLVSQVIAAYMNKKLGMKKDIVMSVEGEE
ncbi:MAG: penicillin-binding protein 2 [bacterium]|nr:penicillin-binding protein 2 [bacterium]